MTLCQIVTKIKEIISKDQKFTIEFYSNEICFSIYESEVVISYTGKDNHLYIDGDLTNGELNTEMVNQLCEIMNILEDNKQLLKSFCVK